MKWKKTTREMRDIGKYSKKKAKLLLCLSTLPSYQRQHKKTKVFDTWLFSVLPKSFHSDQMSVKPTAKKRMHKFGLGKRRVMPMWCFKTVLAEEKSTVIVTEPADSLKTWERCRKLWQARKEKHSMCLWKAGKRGKTHQLHFAFQLWHETGY